MHHRDDVEEITGIKAVERARSLFLQEPVGRFDLWLKQMCGAFEDIVPVVRERRLTHSHQ